MTNREGTHPPVEGASHSAGEQKTEVKFGRRATRLRLPSVAALESVLDGMKVAVHHSRAELVRTRWGSVVDWHAELCGSSELVQAELARLKQNTPNLLSDLATTAGIGCTCLSEHT